MGARSTARVLGWTALCGDAAFLIAWVLGGALQPGYSPFHRGFSELAARGAAHPWIAIAGTGTLALATAALGPALRSLLPPRRAAAAVAVLFVAAGLMIGLAACFRLDCGLSHADCRQLWQAGRLSWHQDAHVWSGLIAGGLVIATPFTIAFALWPAPLGAMSLSAGTTGLLIGLSSFGLGFVPAALGALDLVGLVALVLWLAILAVGVLYETRRAPPPSQLIPLRPRAFLASSWSGEGELLLRPLFVGRLLARRFAARREATWISEQVWRIDDSATFGGTRVQRRQMFCEFVSDDHVHITAGDLPDGIDVWLDEGGYRTSPFRLAVPLGPLPLLVRCHDLSYVEPDGTFVNVVDVRALGLGIPLARVVFRVRPGPDRLPLTALAPDSLPTEEVPA